MGLNWEKDVLDAIAPHIERAAKDAYDRGLADGIAKERNRVLGLIGGEAPVAAAPAPLIAEPIAGADDDDGEADEAKDPMQEYGAISNLVRKALGSAGEEGADAADVIRIIRDMTGTTLEPDQVRQNLKIQARNGFAIRVQRGLYKASDKIATLSSETVRSEPVDVQSVEDTSTGSNPTQAQGREAGPGGGT